MRVTRISRPALIQVCCLILFFLLVLAAFGSLLVENALHPEKSTGRPRDWAKSISGEVHSSVQNVQTRAADGTILQAALYLPSHPHPDYVILLYELGDSRFGMDRLVRMLLKCNYAVLVPDSRLNVLTYGIREAADVHLWASFLYRTQPVTNLYGLGESIGAGVLLESLTLEPRFQAVVAESPFSTFLAIAHDRIGQNLRSDSWPVRVISTPMISSGLLYGRLRYGVDLGAASPLNAVCHTTTPILLIHGLRDDDMPPQHSRTLLLANPRHIVPWFVPKAGHSGAFSADPAVFEERVASFFASHRHGL